MRTVELTGWDRLRHGGLLLDPQRLGEIATHEPGPLSPYIENELRRRSTAILDGSGDIPSFVTFVLQTICGFSPSTGTWLRGSAIPTDWSRTAVTGETVRPRQLWQGTNGAVLPVFIDNEKRVGIGRGRRAVSRTIGWLRTGGEHLALVTNGRQWRLVFAGLDFDAWCEWDLDLWFEEGELSPQVAALRTLIQPVLWAPPERDAAPKLLRAVLDSRKGQSELSKILGERVREAVEILVQGHGEVLRERCADIDPAEIYRAAVRVIMRLVVVLFAESRDLLPRENALYHGSYGLTGLLEQLDRAAAHGGGRLSRSWSAWPRILALFRLVYNGSHHPDLPVPAYGGELFAPGDSESSDGLTHALSCFETTCFDCEVMCDRDVHRMLGRITRTIVKVRQGRSSTWVPAPVDFSDLSSEYIGILYEGLLDFELRTAPAGDPVVFLAVGNQPALPLSRLESMDDAALKNLFEQMKDTSTGEAEEEAAEEAIEEEESTAPAEDTEEGHEIEEEAEPAPEDEKKEYHGDERHTTRTRAEQWARRAVEVAKIVRKPRGTVTPEKRLVHEESVARKARRLVTRVVLPGEWYLVRWGGTRKGSGSFYTRPGLAVPTVQRTLRPLAWDPPVGKNGTTDRDAPPAKWTPKKPEEILALKVADPACGSGTFPVAALRYLTDSLYAALHVHGRITRDGDRSLAALLAGPSNGDTPEERLCEELLPCRPDDDRFEPLLKARLRRHVVERCIYGVDIDPLAVELCRLSLWIETMDRTLPFSFLDHKIKCGNSLVGAWFDQFRHYPAMAWKNREGGDTNHTNGVHYEKGARTKAIKRFVKERLTPDLAAALLGQLELFSPPAASLDDVHRESLALLERLHALPVHDTAERARIYRDELLGSPAWRALKDAMDLWCACWFWPADELEHAPLPSSFADPPALTRAVVERLAREKRFFHWELEFPDVFRAEGSGFDAVLGNPPWDIAKPNSKEFFSNIDPLYRSYGKQEAIRFQTAYFENEDIEHEWLEYNADFRARSNFMKYVASAFGDPEEVDKSQDRFALGRGRANLELHARWRDARTGNIGYADTDHPFRHQGSADINLYKLFLEQAHALLRKGGRFGFIVPSGLYSDHGTGALRERFLSRCRWEWLFGFENREGIFDIHRSFKFNPVIIEKGGETETIRTAFMRRRLEDWERAESIATPYARDRVERFSPRSKAILEIQSARDLEILEKIYANSVLLGDEGPDGWGITYATEFHMTNDSKLFPPRQKWESEGYRPDEYSRWLKGEWRPIEELWAELGVKSLSEGERRCAQPPYDRLPIPRADIPAGIILSREVDAWIKENAIEEKAFPIYRGKMIRIDNWAFDGSSFDEPGGFLRFTEYLISHEDLHHEMSGNPRLVFRDIARATDKRTFISAIIPSFPCGNELPIIIDGEDSWHRCLPVQTALGSFIQDWVARRRVISTHINWHIAEMLAIPSPKQWNQSWNRTAALISFPNQLFSPAYLLSGISVLPSKVALKRHERIRIRCILNSVVSIIYGVNIDDLSYIFNECDFPKGTTGHDARGFWRTDQMLEPELRRTILILVAFHDLQDKIDACGGDREKGIEAFMNQNDGEGWMLPETLRLADYGLGHDDRAKEHQPVASRLGPRFYDWQLVQSPEESWRECHLHARNLLGEEGYRQLLEEIEDEKRGRKKKAYPEAGDAASRAAEKSEDKKQQDLF